MLAIPAQAVALLTVLMLRGPQTVGELRINCDRLHRFADTSAAEAFLHELAARQDGALVVLLPRQPGEREARWAHLLSGAPSASAPTQRGASETSIDTAAPSIAALEAQIAHLADEVEALKATVARLSAALGESAS